MPRIQSVPAVLSAGDYALELEINGTSPFSAAAKNAWRYTGTAQ